MPELPEVETIRRALQIGGRGEPAIAGRRITGGRFAWPGCLATPSRALFWRRVRTARIGEISRRGKFLLIGLEGGEAGQAGTLAVHLRMSGDLMVEPDAGSLPRFCRMHLKLSGGNRLVFTDLRKFGRLWLLRDTSELLGSLGPEPLEADLTARQFVARANSRRRQLKPLLLDQTFLAGLGNIYTDEALHTAGLHPRRRANSLSADEGRLLWRAIRRVLRAGIRRHGSSIDWIYRGGDYQTQLRVYGRTGLPCPACRTPVVRLEVGQRGTHICPACQPES